MDRLETVTVSVGTTQPHAEEIAAVFLYGEKHAGFLVLPVVGVVVVAGVAAAPQLSPLVVKVYVAVYKVRTNVEVVVLLRGT